MDRKLTWTLSCLLILVLGGCTTPVVEVGEPPTSTMVPATAAATTAAEQAPPVESATGLADVIAVEVTGDPGAYRFRVTVHSPDTGCDQYADWWEVVSEEGALIYRRVLTHSHVDEQPFERAGSPVLVEADRVVYVRAHLHPLGYGGLAFKGSVQDGFEPVLDLPADFAADLAEELPLPQGCAF